MAKKKKEVEQSKTSEKNLGRKKKIKMNKFILN